MTDSPGFAPDDAASLSAALLAVLQRRFPGVQMLEPPARIGNGLDSYVYAFRLGGMAPQEWLEPLVLRVYTGAGHGPKARREHDVQTFVAGLGFPAPRPLLLDETTADLGRPFMVMERMTGVPLIRKMQNPLALRRVVRQMAALQVRLHRLPVEGCPLPSSPPLVERLLTEVRAVIERHGLAELEPALAWLDREKGRVADSDTCLTHNDFHPLNILVSNGGLSLLDWSDAALGDRHCDVARTLAIFWMAPYLVPGAAERWLLGALRPCVLRGYVNAYQRDLPLNATRIGYWKALHAAKGIAQVLVAENPGDEADQMRQDVELSPKLLPALRRYFQSYAR